MIPLEKARQHLETLDSTLGTSASKQLPYPEM